VLISFCRVRIRPSKLRSIAAFSFLGLVVVSQSYSACHADPTPSRFVETYTPTLSSSSVLQAQTHAQTSKSKLELVDVVTYEDLQCYVSMAIDPASMLALLDVLDTIGVVRWTLLFLIVSTLSDKMISKNNERARMLVLCVCGMVAGVCCALIVVVTFQSWRHTFANFSVVPTTLLPNIATAAGRATLFAMIFTAASIVSVAGSLGVMHPAADGRWAMVSKQIVVVAAALDLSSTAAVIALHFIGTSLLSLWAEHSVRFPPKTRSTLLHAAAS